MRVCVCACMCVCVCAYTVDCSTHSYINVVDMIDMHALLGGELKYVYLWNMMLAIRWAELVA